MPLAVSAKGGRGGRYGSRPASSYGAGPLTHRHPASPSPCTRGVGDYREPHGRDDAFSSVTRRPEKSQGRLPTRANFTKPSSALQNIRFQTTRHPSLLDRRGSVSDWRFTKARGKENEVYDQNNCQTDNVSSRISSGSNCSPIFMKPSGTLQNIRLQTPRHRSLLDRRVEGANQVPRRSIDKAAPKVNEGKDEVNEQDWQMDPMSSHVSSAHDWNLEFDVTFEGRNHSAHPVKPSAMPRNIRVQMPRNPSLLDRTACSSDNYHQCVGAFNAINERRLPKGCVLTTKCVKQSSSAASNSGKSAPGPLDKVKDKVAIVRSASAHTSGGTVGAKKKEAYITTLGAGGGYGDPHPPPFYKCEVCRKRTAFYRLKCCRLVVGECCGCTCEPAETEEDEKLLQSRRGKVQAGKEKLPKVKLEGSDLFLWQPCSFPAGLMLCMAKRTGNLLQYYFAPVDELMNPKVRVVKATVYNFRQHGRNARSLSVRDELLMREQLR